MGIRVGDRVKFLNEIGEGVVVSVLDRNMVNVETPDGFEMPMMTNQLVVDNPKQSSEISRGYGIEDEVEESDSVLDYLDEEIVIKGFVEVNVEEDNDSFELLFGVVPNDIENPISGGLTTYLINNSNYTLLFQFAHDLGNAIDTIECGVLEPNTRIELDRWREQEFNVVSNLVFSIIPFRKRMDNLKEPVVKRYSFNPIKLYKGNAFIKNDYFRTPALLISLFDKEPILDLPSLMDDISEKEIRKATILKSKSEKRPVKKMVLEGLGVREVDLHIHELVDTTSGLSNREMLEIQMSNFKSEIDKAIKDRVKKIVFIHGKGNGVLKREVVKAIEKSYRKYSYQDASFEKYGYGATMVILRR